MKSYVLVVAIGLLAGCSKESPAGPGVTYKDPLADAEPLAKQTVGGEGGTIEAEGVTLIIPQGALQEETEISIYAANVTPAGIKPESVVFQFLPSGLTFAKTRCDQDGPQLRGRDACVVLV